MGASTTGGQTRSAPTRSGRNSPGRATGTSRLSAVASRGGGAVRAGSITSSAVVPRGGARVKAALAGPGRRGGKNPSVAEPYDVFARHFDAWQQAFGGRYDELILPRVLAALARHPPAVRRVVDLASGPATS